MHLEAPQARHHPIGVFVELNIEAGVVSSTIPEGSLLTSTSQCTPKPYSDNEGPL